MLGQKCLWPSKTNASPQLSKRRCVATPRCEVLSLNLEHNAYGTHFLHRATVVQIMVQKARQRSSVCQMTMGWTKLRASVAAIWPLNRPCQKASNRTAFQGLWHVAVTKMGRALTALPWPRWRPAANIGQLQHSVLRQARSESALDAIRSGKLGPLLTAQNGLLPVSWPPS